MRFPCDVYLGTLSLISVIVNNRYGPIAPPANPQNSSSHNPYSTLKLEEQEGEEEDEEEDTVTWQGRHRN